MNNKDRYGLPLILEYHSDGLLKVVFAPVKANLAKFGNILKNSAKLIGNDIGFLVNLTFSRLRSIEEVNRLVDSNRKKRAGYISAISSDASSIMDSMGSNKVLPLMLCPGLYFTTQTLGGVRDITSAEFRASIGEYGFDKIPIIGQIFSPTGGAPSANNPFRQFASCDPSDQECYARAWTAMTSKMGGNQGDDDDKGMLSKIALKLNSIFLFSGDQISGPLILEGDEENFELPEETKAWIQQKFMSEIEKSWPIPREDVLKDYQKLNDKIVKEAETVISLNTALAVATNPDEFFKTLEKLKELGGEKVANMDIERLSKNFDDAKEKLKNDNKSMEEIRKGFANSKTEVNDDNINLKLDEIVLSQYKGSFLQELKTSLIEYYEDVYARITEEVDVETLNLMAGTEYGAKFVKLVKDYTNKLDLALSKLQQG